MFQQQGLPLYMLALVDAKYQILWMDVGIRGMVGQIDFQSVWGSRIGPTCPPACLKTRLSGGVNITV